MTTLFRISPVLFLPLAVVISLALFKFPPFSSIFIGALVGGAVAVFVAPERVIAFVGAGDGNPNWLTLIKGVWLALAHGNASTTGYPTIDQLASRGGMASMLNTIWLVIAALAIGGIVEKAGILDQLITPIVDATKSAGALIVSLAAAVVTTNIVAADQYIAVVLPARMFRSAFAKCGFAPVVLSRAVGNSATPTSALIPWNSCGAYMAATLGVATLSYTPYAIFNFASPLLVIATTYAGLRIPHDPAPESSAPDARIRQGLTHHD